MKRFLWCLITATALAQTGNAQYSRYLVQFKNKGSNPYTLSAPAAYLSNRAIDRRTRYQIQIDSTDLPVTPQYIDSLRQAGAVTILNVSKWLNQVSIQTTDATALAKINTFSFVQSVSGIAARMAGLLPDDDKFDTERESPVSLPRQLNIQADYYNYGASANQVRIHNGDFLHNIGLRGQNMIIGMLDAGFNNYLTVTAFDSARANGQILGTWDFVARHASVNEDDAHGMECFSTIAANIPNQFVGTAPRAGFYLFRTEDAATEFPIEEHNWVCGAERVDSAGGDLISSSLGYADGMTDPAFNHTYAQMNGNTTIAARGADLAAKKGILVVNSAGNEGNKAWHYIITPADGDSVLAVGAVDGNGAVASFSSYGPSSDGQVKPDVSSVGQGTIVQYPNNVIGPNSGTSFSAPNMAGLATCLWQGFPEFNNMKIIYALRSSASISSAPNDRMGYGIPDMKKALMYLLKEYATTSATVTNCSMALTWKSKDAAGMKYEIQRRLPGQSSFLKVADLPATGTVFGSQSYQYSDNLSDVPTGTITYRIRQVLDTATASFFADYIDTVSVTLNTNCLTGANSVTLMPNPARNQLNLKVVTPVAAQHLVIRIFNGKGQMVAEQRTSKSAGLAFFDVPVSYLAAGKYYVSVYADNQLVETKELIKL